MSKQGYKRLVCGILAAQLCCAPLAQAAEATDKTWSTSAMYSRAEERLGDTLARRISAQKEELLSSAGEKLFPLTRIVIASRDDQMSYLTTEDVLSTEEDKTEITPASGEGLSPSEEGETQLSGGGDLSSTEDGVTTSSDGEVLWPPEEGVTTPDGGDASSPEEGDVSSPEEGEVSPPEDEDVLPSEDGEVLPPEAEDMLSPDMEVEAAPLDKTMVLSADNAVFTAIGSLGYVSYFSKNVQEDYNMEGGELEDSDYNLIDVNWQSGSLLDSYRYPWGTETEQETPDIDLSSIKIPRIPNLEFLGWAIRSVENSEEKYNSIFNLYSYVAAEDMEFYCPIIYDGTMKNSSDFFLGKENVYFDLNDMREQLVGMAAPSGDGSDYYAVQFGGLWQESTNAEITKLDVTVGDTNTVKIYDRDIRDESANALDILDGVETFSGNTDYYARVNADTDEVKFEFFTFEPGSVVTVDGTYGSDTIAIKKEDKTTNPENPSAPLEMENLEAKEKRNSKDNPARGLWEIIVPLEMAESENQYNDVTIVVTPPNGKESDAQTYRFHIQRLNQPQMSYENGNTPAAILGENVDAFQKDWMMINIPGLTIPLYDGKFAPEAWGGNKNVDLDEKAIIVYQNSQVVLPELSFSDSRGMSTNLEGTLKRTLSLKTADPLTTETVIGGATKVQYYVDGTLQNTPASETIDLEKEEILNLQGMNVVPGVYTLEYSYEDEITGLIYDSEGTAFEMAGVANAENFHRTLVVLPIPGDVDMDGHVTAADARTLRKLLEQNEITTIAPLFLYRVCDTNGDGEVNFEDVETLRGGATVQQVNPAWGTSDYFYTSISKGTEEPERKPVPAATPDVGEGESRISLEYLGKADGNTLPGKNGAGLDQEAEIGVGDSFWMGLKLEGAEGLTNVLGSTQVYSATLAYDSAYLELYSSQNLAPADLIRAACVASWGEGAVCYFPKVLVKDSGTEIDIGMADFGSSDPAKAVPSIGTEGSVGGTLRELHVTVVLPEGTSLTDGYLLQVPFTMTNYSRSGKLVEPVFGPRELCFAGDEKTGVYSMVDSVFGGGTKNIASALNYGGSEKVLLGEDTTDPITSKTITYGESLPGIPSSEIKGEPELDTFPDWLSCEKEAGLNKLIGTPTAAGTFNFYVGGEKHQIIVEKKELAITLLPQERYYGEKNPEPTFDYDVTQLVDWDRNGLVETSSATEKQSILTNLAGYKIPTASYVESLAEDSDVVTTDTNANIGAGTYFITVKDGALRDYEIIYVDGNGDQVELATQTFTIKPRPILVKEIVSPSPVCSINAGTTILRVGNLFGTYAGTSDDNFTVQSPAEDGTYGGLPLSSENPVYMKTDGTSDQLKIGYEVNYIRDENLSEGETNFHMTAPVETRNVKVHSLSLADDYGDNQNYVLVNAVNPDEPHFGRIPIVGTATGQVIKRYVNTFKLSQIRTGIENNAESKSSMLYTHGDPLHIDGIWAEIHMNDEQPGDPTINAPSANFDQFGISIFLAGITSDGKPEEDKINIDPKADKLPDISRTQMNGKYIWIATTSYTFQEETKEYVETVLYDHSYYPLTVNQASLTLTIGAENRYYGEANAAKAVVSYQVNDLAEMDRDGKTGDFLADFAGADGYKAPTVKRVETLNGSTEVTAASNASDHYYITITGAESTDYKFNYIRGEEQNPGAIGYNTLRVLPRPIVVNRITAQPQSIFADAGDDETKLTKQIANTANSEVVLSLPEADGEYHYQTGTAKDDGTYDIAVYGDLMPLQEKQALIGDDVLSFTYTAEYKRDREGTQPYFILTKAEEPRDVFITMVELTGSQAGNYVLVFPSTTNAIRGYPGTATTLEDPSGDRQTTGIVKLRKVESVKIKELPKLDYVHGDQMTLNRDNGVGRKPLIVTINYDGESQSKDITFTSVENFRSNGLHLTWDHPWTGDPEQDKEVEITTNDDLVVTYANHNGRKIYVTLEQLGGLEPISATDSLTVNVAKANLTLSVVNQDRYYGEENQYKFTFKLTQLAGIDLRLAGLDLEQLGKDAEGEGTDAGCGILETVNAPYSESDAYKQFKNPNFETTAKINSNAGQTYTLALSGGVLTNYNIDYSNGAIRVFRRPILVREVTAKKVVSLSITEAKDENKLTVKKELAEDGQGKNLLLDRADIAGSGYIGSYEYSAIDADYKEALGNKPLPLTGSALATGDSVTISFDATFPRESDPKRPTIPTGAEGVECPVTISGMKLSTESAKNYILVYEHKSQNTPIEIEAEGWLGERKINKITLKFTPQMRFNYGDVITAAKLSDFEFWVNDGSGDDASLGYDNVGIEPEVYYWNSSWTIPTTQEELAKLKTEKADYKVTLGERLTIAKNDKGFSHQGMQLLFLYPESQSTGSKYLPPVVTTLQKGIEIIPKELTYTLEADSKVYDGKRDTTGRLLLTKDDIFDGDDVSCVQDEIKWNFVSADVAYDSNPVNQDYTGLTIIDIPVEVTNITLTGDDADNYHINSSVLKNWTNNNPDYVLGRPTEAPKAKITKAERLAAPGLDNIQLVTDIRTNIITIRPNGVPSGSGKDAERFEYALEYIVNGVIQTTDWQVSPRFDVEEMGLPRGSWYRASIRFAESWNYKPTAGTLSAEGDLAELAAEAQAKLDAADAPDPESTPVDRPAASLTRTYAYRLEIFSTSDRKTNDTGPVSIKSEAIWFTDTAEYQKQEELDWALDNVKNKQGYAEYYWDETKNTRVTFPLSIKEPLSQEIEQWDDVDGVYVKKPVIVNENGNLKIFVSARKSSGGNIPLVEKLTVEPAEVVAILGDEPFQLTATYSPAEAMGQLRWKSSDPSVVTVDSHGMLTFVGVGEAVITVTASYGGATAEVLVTVNPPVPVLENKTFLNMGGLMAFMEVDGALRFYPERTMTRGEAAMVLAKVFQIPEGEKAGEPIRFADMKADAPYAQAVDMLSAYGIVVGVENGDFEGERIITRAEMVVMLARMLRLKPEEETTRSVFLDGNLEDTWAAPYLNTLYKAGVIQGVGDQYFAPSRALTRAEMASFIARTMLNRVDMDSDQLIVPVDVPENYWAYRNILRAINSGDTLVAISERE